MNEEKCLKCGKVIQGTRWNLESINKSLCLGCLDNAIMFACSISTVNRISLYTPTTIPRQNFNTTGDFTVGSPTPPSDMSITCGTGQIKISFKTGSVELPAGVSLEQAAVDFWNAVSSSFIGVRQNIILNSLPKELFDISERLRTQDNRITENPMFCVQEKRRRVGIDTDYASNYCWRDCESEETIYDDDPDFKGEPEGSEWEKYGYIDEWHTVMVAFTEAGCKEYLRLNGHNHKETRIYVESFRRNPEMVFLRKWLMELKEAK